MAGLSGRYGLAGARPHGSSASTPSSAFAALTKNERRSHLAAGGYGPHDSIRAETAPVLTGTQSDAIDARTVTYGNLTDYQDVPDRTSDIPIWVLKG